MPGGWSSDYDDENPEEVRKRQRASENSARLAKRQLELIRQGVADPDAFALTPALLCELNALAMDGLIENAGKFRECDVVITASLHEPPPWQEVQGHIAKLCQFVQLGGGGEAVYLAAFVLWFINRVHPFEDGNGRVARAASYIVLNVALGQELAGEVTLIERLVMQKRQYTLRLEAADRAWKNAGAVVGRSIAPCANQGRDQLQSVLKLYCG